jgi:acyl-coenzyme A thioesterase PaaI-like protein
MSLDIPTPLLVPLVALVLHVGPRLVKWASSLAASGKDEAVARVTTTIVVPPEHIDHRHRQPGGR